MSLQLIRDNERNFKDMINRGDYDNATILDVWTAFYVLLQTQHVFDNVTDDKRFLFVLGFVRNVNMKNRMDWLNHMFKTYQTISSVQETDPHWLLLKTNLVHYALS